jgi:hypothetical protein
MQLFKDKEAVDITSLSLMQMLHHGSRIELTNDSIFHAFPIMMAKTT